MYIKNVKNMQYPIRLSKYSVMFILLSNVIPRDDNFYPYP